MEQVKDKKKKLTLKNFSGGAAAISSYAKGSGNKPVLIEKKKIYSMCTFQCFYCEPSFTFH